MKKLTSEVLDRAVALKADGKSNKEIMAELDLSHSQLERHLVLVNIAAYGGFLKQPATLTEKAAQIAKLRLEGQSWGVIAIRYKEPESRTRRDFKEAGGLDSKGMRIGKGGRYVADDPRFYSGADRAKLGTELVPSVPLLDQVPNPDDTPKRVLPTVAASGFAPKGTSTRKPRKATAKATAKKTA